MAGAGYKAWSAGDVLTASDVNTYLMQQSVMTFAGTAARASAVAAPSEGMLSYRTDDDVLETYVTANGVSQWVESSKLSTRAAANTNMLYNGAMQVAQYGTSGTAVTTAKPLAADRWGVYADLAATVSVTADAPTGSGFRNCLKFLHTAAGATPSAAQTGSVFQKLEGQDLQRIKKGTSSAEKVTLSFWVKSNKTGTYVVECYDYDNTRMVNAQYSVSAADTWEKKVITFPADTTGAFDNDNAASLMVEFFLYAGTNYSSGSIQSTWAAVTTANRAAGQVNLAAATNNYWQVTGVQLEIGNAATPFEFEGYEETLRKCQRYYETGDAMLAGYAVSGQTFGLIVPFKVTKRVSNGSFTLTDVFGTNGATTPYVTDVTTAGALHYRASTSTAQTAWWHSWKYTAEL